MQACFSAIMILDKRRRKLITSVPVPLKREMDVYFELFTM